MIRESDQLIVVHRVTPGAAVDLDIVPTPDLISDLTIESRHRRSPLSVFWVGDATSGLLEMDASFLVKSSLRPMEEAIYGVGEGGLWGLLGLGFLPGEEGWEYLDSTSESERLRGLFPEMDRFMDDNGQVAPDGTRLNLELIARVSETLPRRIFVSPSMGDDEIEDLKARLARLPRRRPVAVGYPLRRHEMAAHFILPGQQPK